MKITKLEITQLKPKQYGAQGICFRKSFTNAHSNSHMYTAQCTYLDLLWHSFL